MLNSQRTILGLTERLAERPDWLAAALDSEVVARALAEHVPEVASERLRIVDCAIERLKLMPGGRYMGTYNLVVAESDGPNEVVPITVTLMSPAASLEIDLEAPRRPLGSEGWSCYLPELRLLCEYKPPERDLEAFPLVMDPQESRLLIERAMRASGPAYAQLRIRSCAPRILNYKPGTRCTILCELEYADVPQSPKGPERVIVKIYRKRKGERAHRGMVDLWNSPLAGNAAVRIAEPLGYLPTEKVLVQSSLAADMTLEEVLHSALVTGEPAETVRLNDLLDEAAAGLAALHQSGVVAHEAVTWEERITDIPDLIARLATVAPDVARDVTPLWAYLHEQAAQYGADQHVPSHGSFDSDQVVVGEDGIGFIDFDSFCSAEPALDVGHFRASLVDSGMKLIEDESLASVEGRAAYLGKLDEMADAFLERYASSATISRPRLALWECLDYLRDALQLWTKPRPDRPEAVTGILEHHLRRMSADAALGISTPFES